MVFGLIDLLGACGPVLAAILVASITSPEPSNAPRRRRWTTFVTVFALTYGLEVVVGLFVTKNLSLEMLLIFLAYSSIASLVVSCVYHPKQGVAVLMSGLKRVSVRNVWIWVAVLLPFAWQLLGGAIAFGLGGLALLGFNSSAILVLPASYPFTFFFGGPLTEEPGWRGFATPSIQQRFTPLATGLIIGFIWSLWHFPLYFTPLYGGGLLPFLFRFMFNVPLGVLFTWYYNRSGGNLFGSMLFHTSFNTVSDIFGPFVGALEILFIIISAVFIVFHDKMHRKIANPLAGQIPELARS